MPRRHTTARHQLTAKQRKAKRAARAASLKPRLTPEEGAALSRRLHDRIERLARALWLERAEDARTAGTRIAIAWPHPLAEKGYSLAPPDMASPPPALPDLVADIRAQLRAAGLVCARK